MIILDNSPYAAIESTLTLQLSKLATFDPGQSTGTNRTVHYLQLKYQLPDGTIYTSFIEVPKLTHLHYILRQVNKPNLVSILHIQAQVMQRVKIISIERCEIAKVETPNLDFDFSPEAFHRK